LDVVQRIGGAKLLHRTCSRFSAVEPVHQRLGHVFDWETPHDDSPQALPHPVAPLQESGTHIHRRLGYRATALPICCDRDRNMVKGARPGQNARR
jgi:hypothetical protein